MEGWDGRMWSPVNPQRDFFEMVRWGAEGWDGSEPLRPVES
jgi:hypothetical protein